MTAKYNPIKVQSIIAKHCKDAMLAVHKSETTLFARMVNAWDELNDGSLSIPDFRKEFKAYGVSTGYSERWIAECLTDAGFRVRAERSDNGKARKAKPTKVEKIWADFQALSAADRKAFLKLAISK